ncbi:protein PFC0760c-like [Sardina pilchardus]|uniref:protein PFC0760c-like n=1 Tax=Sardina pilchardus TaxID=27697 RepID=UPI002E120030
MSRKSTFRKNLQKGPDHKGETTYIMYHGTTMKAARKIERTGFIQSEDGMLGPGVYVSRSFAKAACYPRGAKGHKRAVLKLSVRVGRVKMIDRQGHHLQKSWHQAGYDTAWVPPNCGMVKSGRQENCVWDPKRIRVLSIQSNNRESNDEESTDEDDGDSDDDDDDDDEERDNEDYDEDHKEESDDEEDDDGVNYDDDDDEEGDDDYDEDHQEEGDDDDDVTDNSSDESEDEEDSATEGGASGYECTVYYKYGNADNASPDHAYDRSSPHSDDDDDDDDDKGSSCGEREYSGESSDNDYY